MKPRHKRFVWIAAGLAVLGVAVGLVLKAFNSNLVFFYTPTQVANKEVPQGKPFRLGGLVTAGSVQRDSNGLTVRFSVTDTAKSVPVSYTGILPDLFKEGKGVVAQGRVGADGVFTASEVLAKHDENYMAPEAAEALRKAGHPIKGEMFAGEKPVVTQQPSASSPPSPAPAPAGAKP
ncbi:MAG: cytochrome c maturation protein CcmE [Betaproteobacteria bacterium]|nr:cytochrome c maturation protein CcmE [Betaproteobacteria bacterium]